MKNGYFAILFGLMSLLRSSSYCDILVLSDSTTAVACINKFGSVRSIKCDRVAHEIWNWAIPRNIHISATHIPGILNVQADSESRDQAIHTEWKLNENIFNFICTKLNFSPKIDLFASRRNTQLPTFVSYRPDPKCIGVNAFLMNWEHLHLYAFPPFICMTRVLQKMVQDKARGIVIGPNWPTQAYFTRLKEISMSYIILPPRRDMLYLPNNPDTVHPLHKKLSLIACLVDGNL